MTDTYVRLTWFPLLLDEEERTAGHARFLREKMADRARALNLQAVLHPGGEIEVSLNVV